MKRPDLKGNRWLLPLRLNHIRTRTSGIKIAEIPGGCDDAAGVHDLSFLTTSNVEQLTVGCAPGNTSL